MKPQTEDNLRCLAAVIFVIAVLGWVGATQPSWLLSLPTWVQVTALLILLFAVLHLFNFRRKVVGKDRVSFDETVVTRTLPDGKTETVRWDDLQEVGIVTTDEGPLTEDLYWMLLGKNGGCAVSNSAQGMAELLSRLQQLPGFDNKVVINAMGSATNDKFVCWKRS